MHIERRHLKVRELVAKQLISATWVATQGNEADILTKAMSAAKFVTLRELVGLRTNSEAKDVGAEH